MSTPDEGVVALRRWLALDGPNREAVIAYLAGASPAALRLALDRYVPPNDAVRELWARQQPRN